MKKFGCFAVAALAASFAAAAPAVSGVSLSVDSRTRLVTVSYSLSAPAIVTVAFETNGVAISPKTHAVVAGDVNRLVSAQTGTIRWQPRGADVGVVLPENGLSARVSAWRPQDPPPYLVVNLNAGGKREYYSCAEALPGGVGDPAYRGGRLLMRRIPAAGSSFMMGSPWNEFGRQTGGISEKPHVVGFTNDWYMGVFEFTQRQYEIVMGNSGNSMFSAADDSSFRPVEKIAYGGTVRGFRNNGYKWPQNGHDVAAGSLMKKIRQAAGNALLFDLPTEAQWEFSARAGSLTSLPNGLELTGSLSSCTNADKVGWTSSNANGETHPVGLLSPNGWGLYDVIGNVSEECLDTYDESAPLDLTAGPDIDPPGQVTTARSQFITRGGSYSSTLAYDRLASRLGANYSDSAKSNIGLRLWCPVPNEVQ